MNASSGISADSSVASSVSLDEEDESPAKVKKKDDNHVNIQSHSLAFFGCCEKKLLFFLSCRTEYQKRDLRWTKRLILQQF